MPCPPTNAPLTGAWPVTYASSGVYSAKRTQYSPRRALPDSVQWLLDDEALRSGPPAPVRRGTAGPSCPARWRGAGPAASRKRLAPDDVVNLKDLRFPGLDADLRQDGHEALGECVELLARFPDLAHA